MFGCLIHGIMNQVIHAMGLTNDSQMKSFWQLELTYLSGTVPPMSSQLFLGISLSL
jgi:hypothetical protein